MSCWAVPLRQRAQVLDDVDVLVGLLVDAIAGGLTRDGHEGRAVEVGVGDTRGEVGRSGPERRETHPRRAGQPTVGVGHEGSPLLVARGNEGDPRVGERVQDVQNLLAGQSEDVAHTLVLETLHDEIGGLHDRSARRSIPT